MILKHQTTHNCIEYRFGFQSQEKDDEIFGSTGSFLNFTYRGYDSRIVRFWSPDPVAKNFPWNSSYAFCEDSPIGYIELEGLEKVRFGTNVVNFSVMNEKQVKAELDKYYKYHQGNLDADDILKKNNDNEYWEVNNLTNIFNRSTGTLITKYVAQNSEGKGLGKPFSIDVKRDISQTLYHIDDLLEGSSDPANTGTITQKDVVVGLGVIGTMTGVGAALEAGTITVVGAIALINNLDDALGGFTNGNGSLSQDLTPDEYKQITNSLKTISSALSTGVNSKQIIKNKDYNKTMKVLSTVSDAVGTGTNAKSIIDE